MSSEEVRAFREELKQVRNLALGLEARLERRELQQTRTRAEPPWEVSGSSDSFSVVSAGVPSTGTSRYIATDDIEGRTALAKAIGAFLRRAYDGVHM